jgi:hypothetical protein
MKIPMPKLPNIKIDTEQYFSLQKNIIILWTSRITFFFIFMSLCVLLYFWKNLPPEIPLWYSKPWGVDRLANPYWLFLLPGASFIWFCINAFLSIRITKNHLVFSQILFLSSLLVSVFSFVTLSMIIWIIS